MTAFCLSVVFVACTMQAVAADANNETGPAHRSRHLDSDNNPLFTNRLIEQDSLYLQQHAHNPVNWWSWEEAAFARARKLDKPILLSIGYSTCHWCHVMERESFENLEIAEFINQNFIPIKVDREEHPDIDELYLTAVQMLSGKAGWPLTAVLTPDGLPFFGGTYFPPDQFLGLLGQIDDTWDQRREAIMEQAERLKSALTKVRQSSGDAKSIDESVMTKARQRILQGFSAESRGNNSAFPREPEMQFLLHRVIGQLEQETLDIVLQRLKDIANGGIHDQLGGGFHRYSVDSNWQVPHFEKMLYNQAQLGQIYSIAYMLSGEPQMRSVAESTFDFMLRELQSPKGGFYAAVDAESDGQEGSYYLWDLEQLSETLNKSELALASAVMGVTAQGNFAGRNVLQRAPVSKGVYSKQEVSALREKLLQARARRIPPRTDTKIITAWNAMSISALLTGYHATDREQYRAAALRAAVRIWQRAFSTRKGLARTIPGDGKRIDGALEDYAYFANSLLDIYDLNNDKSWLVRAEKVASQMIERFHDSGSGGFLISSTKKQNQLIVSLVTARDDAINSGNSIATQVLARLFRRTGNVHYRRTAQQVLSYFSRQLLATPESLSGMLIAAELLNQGEIGQTQYGARSRVRVSSSVVDKQFRVQIDILPGWHINSYRVLEPALIPTALLPVDSQCTSIGKVEYPEDMLVSLGFQKDELLVYKNQVIVRARTGVPAGATCKLVAAELKIQACSDEVCLSPETIKIRATLPQHKLPAE